MHRTRRALHLSGALPGLRGKEAENTDLVLDGGDTLLFKDTRKVGEKQRADVVMAAGSQFVTVLRERGARKVNN